MLILIWLRDFSGVTLINSYPVNNYTMRILKLKTLRESYESLLPIQTVQYSGYSIAYNKNLIIKNKRIIVKVPPEKLNSVYSSSEFQQHEHQLVVLKEAFHKRNTGK